MSVLLDFMVAPVWYSWHIAWPGIFARQLSTAWVQALRQHIIGLLHSTRWVLGRIGGGEGFGRRVIEMMQYRRKLGRERSKVRNIYWTKRTQRGVLTKPRYKDKQLWSEHLMQEFVISGD